MSRKDKAMIIAMISFTDGEISGRIHHPAAYLVIALGVTICFLLAIRWFGEEQ